MHVLNLALLVALLIGAKGLRTRWQLPRSDSATHNNPILEQVEYYGMVEPAKLLTEPLKLQLEGHLGDAKIAQFELGGLAGAGLGFIISGLATFAQDTWAYSNCVKKWIAMKQAHPELVDNFVEAMRPAAHQYRGGSWKSGRTWTDAAQNLQRKLGFIKSANMVQYKGKRVVDWDSEWAMLRWCVDGGSSMYGFLSVMAFYVTGYLSDHLLQPEWWSEDEPIWGSFRRQAVWRVYTSAWGCKFCMIDALAFRRPIFQGNSQRERIPEKQLGITPVYSRLQIAAFVDTLPLQYFRGEGLAQRQPARCDDMDDCKRDGRAVYPPNINNIDVLKFYYEPYLKKIADNHELLLAGKQRYLGHVNQFGVRVGPLSLSDFDTFWSGPEKNDKVHFIKIAAESDATDDHGGLIGP